MAILELELQQELQRFATQFVDRITQATEELERSSRSEVRDEALRKNLLYVSSALEIATGQFSEINLLDMIVFIRLSRNALETHWIPELYGENARDLADVFARSEEELAAVATEALSVAQRTQLANLIEAWLADNPSQIRVEGIRLADFSAAVGTAAMARASEARGLLSSVKGATHAANQALHLSERGLFLFHRMPFLWRLQARLGARQVLGDAVAQMTEGPKAPVVRATQQVHQLVQRGLTYAVVALGGMALFWRLSRR